MINQFYGKESGSLLNRNSFVKMASINNYAKLVEVRIEFMSLGEVDTMNEKFQAIVKIKSKWIENENIKDYDPKEYWNPKLFIENALHVILYNLYI